MTKGASTPGTAGLYEGYDLKRRLMGSGQHTCECSLQLRDALEGIGLLRRGLSHLGLEGRQHPLLPRGEGRRLLQGPSVLHSLL